MESLGNSPFLEVQAGTTVISPRRLAPGSYYMQLSIAGNSLLSTLNLTYADPGTNVAVKYFHFASGQFLEQIILKASHTVLTDVMLSSSVNSNISDEILVTRIHNKPYIVVEITGGEAELSVYCTSLSSFSADLDAALKKDGDFFNNQTDKFMPIGGIDRNDNKWYAVSIKDGALYVVSSPSTAIEGQRIYIKGIFDSVPGSSVIENLYTVPIGKKLDIEHLVVSSPASIDWTVEVMGDWIAKGFNGPQNTDSTRRWAYTYRLLEGEQISFTFVQNIDSPINKISFIASAILSDI